LQLGGTISTAEVEMARVARNFLRARRVSSVTALDVPGTGDYLNKIVDLIRGCGFAFAIYSDATPARSLANIFFEVGVALLIGKPVQLLVAGSAPTPSDFIRTEWISYDPARRAEFSTQLKGSLVRIIEGAEYYHTLGSIALLAERPDLEEAFERLKQAILISNSRKARADLRTLRERLRSRSPYRNSRSDDLASHQARLLQAVDEFLELLPA
jgi:hypothetical protein